MDFNWNRCFGEFDFSQAQDFPKCDCDYYTEYYNEHCILHLDPDTADEEIKQLYKQINAHWGDYDYWKGLFENQQIVNVEVDTCEDGLYEFTITVCTKDHKKSFEMQLLNLIEDPDDYPEYIKTQIHRLFLRYVAMKNLLPDYQDNYKNDIVNRTAISISSGLRQALDNINISKTARKEVNKILEDLHSLIDDYRKYCTFQF